MFRPAIVIRPASNERNAEPVFSVRFQGLRVGQKITLDFRRYEAGKAEDQMPLIGSLEGEIVLVNRDKESPLFGLKVTKGDPAPAKDDMRVGFVGQPGGAITYLPFRYNVNDPATGFADLPNADPRKPLLKKVEGDSWDVRASIRGLPIVSPVFTVARIRRALMTRFTPNANVTYDWHAGNRVTLYNDASENAAGTAGAFHDLEEAVRKAQQFVFVVDWSFHPYMRLARTETGPMPDPAANKAAYEKWYIEQTFGHLLVQRAKAGALVAIHTWRHPDPGDKGPVEPDNNEAIATFNRIADVIESGKKRPDNLLWRASKRQEGGFADYWSHHQKFVVLDSGPDDPNQRREVRVFWGGLDITQGRFDWPEHPIVDGNPASLAAFKRGVYYNADERNLRSHKTIVMSQRWHDWYNGEFSHDQNYLRQPWHDIHGQIIGPTAWDMLREFVGRWICDPRPKVTLGDGAGDTKVLELYQKLFDPAKYVQQWEHPDQNGCADRAQRIWSAQVYRSQTQVHWTSDKKPTIPQRPEAAKFDFQWYVQGRTFERSIQDAYLKVIAQAEQYLFFENQYWIGKCGGKVSSTLLNEVPDAIVKRIKEKLNDEFHVYVIIPMFPEGVPDTIATYPIRTLERKTIEWMVQEVSKAAAARGKIWQDYLSFYFPANWRHNNALDLNYLERTRRVNNKNEKYFLSRENRVTGNLRYYIYVHSKMMMADDRYIILGSANVNERSMHGERDSEICIGLWPDSPQHIEACVNQLKAFRKRIWGEHLAPGANHNNLAQIVADWEKPGSPRCVQQVRKAAVRNYYQFRKGQKNEGQDGHLMMWPLDIRDGKLGMAVKKAGVYTGELEQYLYENAINVPGRVWGTNVRQEENYLPDFRAANDDWIWLMDTYTYSIVFE
jgi:phospholipase D1/2